MAEAFCTAGFTTFLQSQIPGSKFGRVTSITYGISHIPELKHKPPQKFKSGMLRFSHQNVRIDFSLETTR